MSHTNSTPNYNLPQYVGSDIINPLTDTNGAYSDIDTALKQIADAVADDTSDIAELKTKVGTDALTTDAQTLSGAVNELDAELNTASTGVVSRVTNAENDIDVLESQMTTATGNITTIQQNVTALDGEIDAIDTRVGTAETKISNLESDMQTANAAIATKASTARVDTLETTVGTGLAALGTEIEAQASALTLKTMQVTDTGTLGAQSYQEISHAHGITDTGVKLIAGYKISGDADFNVLGVWIDNTNCYMAVENPDATADNYTITFDVVYQ